MKHYFYFKDKKSIKPFIDLFSNQRAKEILEQIYLDRNKYNIPDYFLENWNDVALYNATGNVEKARSILLEPKKGAYHLNNRLNDLTGKEWVKFSCSWFIFNALKEDLDEEKKLDSKLEDHPATFSPTMISGFLRFFTKKGAKVLDPLCGIGSTLEACRRTQRIGFGIELNPKYYKLCLKRVPGFEKNIFNADAKNILELGLPQMDFCISSPPYWNILHRSTHNFRVLRERRELDVRYSDEINDLGNIEDYEYFLGELSNIYFRIFDIMKKGSYIVIIVKNVKKKGILYPLAWDLARILSKKYILKDEKIWIQDKMALAPYGYPFSWASNILHHYCLILRKGL